MTRPRKNPLLVLLPAVLMALLLWLVVAPWVNHLDLHNPWLSSLARINAVIWAVILWWSLHHLVFQQAALLKQSLRPRREGSSVSLQFSVLYLTCDDFQPRSCLSCLRQDYPEELYRIIICDDSSNPRYIDQINQFVDRHPSVTVLRRGNQLGFKAGNLNYAFKRLRPDEEWAVIVDADQVLSGKFLRALNAIVADQPATVAFVQAGHRPDPPRPPHGDETSDFREAMGHEIRIFYERDLAWREKFGFLPFVGHGAAVRKGAWNDIGGFPEVVSEDFAFAMAAYYRGWTGAHAERVRSRESFPKDFGAFLVRIRKFASGSAELFRSRWMWQFLLIGRASFTERVDLVMQFLWYILIPIVIINGFLSAYVCHWLWNLGLSPLHPFLPYLFVTMSLLTWSVVISATPDLISAARYWFWSVAIYSASLPIAATYFIFFAILGWSPRFERTPKDSERSPSFSLAGAAIVSLGLIALGASLIWRSPFSFVLASYGTSYISFPFYGFLNRPSSLGVFSRMIIWTPGALLIIAIISMWIWGNF